MLCEQLQQRRQQQAGREQHCQLGRVMHVQHMHVLSLFGVVDRVL